MPEQVHILIVEDVAEDADLAKHEIRRTIQDCEFRVVTTRKDFLDNLQTFQPDLILADYTLPRFDGLEALKLTFQYAPLTPFIIWSGSIREDLAVECMKAGASDYIFKENLKRLGPAVLRALEEKELLIARKQAEQALRESEHQMRALVTSLDDVVFEFDEQGTYLNIWAADESLLAQPKAELIGKRMKDVLGEEDSRPFIEVLKRVLASGQSEMIEYPMQVLSGQRWFMARVSPIMTQDTFQRTASMLIRDITARKRAERALRMSEARYRELFVPRPTLYVPAVQFQTGASLLVLRTSVPLESVTRIARSSPDPRRCVAARWRARISAPAWRCCSRPSRPRASR